MAKDAHPEALVDLELRCPPDHQVLSLVRTMVADVARWAGFREDLIDEIVICVDEACANVIDHAYGDLQLDESGRPPRLCADANSPHVSILITVAPRGLTLTISDRGLGQEGNFASGAESLEEYVARERPRGLGLYIIRKFMDEVHVEFPQDNAGTRLTMTKHFDEMHPPGNLVDA